MKSKHYIYIIECHDGTFYTGYTNRLERRIQAHNEGRAAKYTRGRTPVTLRYYETFTSKTEAMKREYAIKQLTKLEKEQLIRRVDDHVDSKQLSQ
ncbi:GIY-YIG nuclease family protein [Tuberibacillus sp. Marseille-P3662]|uniref:GIY-YIG nuclease family protein n=1 Tax=Tuberibacillus sp. Marseille-P3662 TaxID=1965358 RepID=UPI000A1C8E85|nr:GIY-YIG nuclease family protein [Tuberibacillus sp. Marseille-P3662]